MSNQQAISEVINEIERLLHIAKNKVPKAIDIAKKGELTDLQLMSCLYLERHVNQCMSSQRVMEFSDQILISRSMFEGALYLIYCLKHPKMASQWRYHHYVQFMDVYNENDFPSAMREEIVQNKEKIDAYFQKSNGKYDKKWSPDNIRDMAAKINPVVDRMYESYYKPMSSYHHWNPTSVIMRSSINCNQDGSKLLVETENFNAIIMVLFGLMSSLQCYLEVVERSDSKDIFAPVAKLLDRIEGIKVTKVTVTGAIG